MAAKKQRQSSKILTARKVGKLFRVDRSTVCSWLEKKLLDGFTTPTGRWRVYTAAVESFRSSPVEILLISEVAAMFRVDPKSVYRWFDEGLIKGFLTPGGERRVYVDSLEPYVDGGTGPILITTEVAKIFGVNEITIVRWATIGKIESFRTPGGHYRFRKNKLRKVQHQ